LLEPLERSLAASLGFVKAVRERLVDDGEDPEALEKAIGRAGDADAAGQAAFASLSIDEAHSFERCGCSDVGQLCVLLSEALQEPVVDGRNGSQGPFVPNVNGAPEPCVATGNE
jgi:hypothetical protein